MYSLMVKHNTVNVAIYVQFVVQTLLFNVFKTNDYSILDSHYYTFILEYHFYILIKWFIIFSMISSPFIITILASIAILASIIVITNSNPIISVIYLIAVFVISACYLVANGITYIGLAYLIIYVGAVAVLFLFVIMILNIRLSEIVTVGYEYTKNIPLAIIIGILFVYEIINIIPSNNIHFTDWINNINAILLGVNNNVNITSQLPIADVSFTNLTQAQSLGINLYTHNTIWLLITSFVLLLAIIGPIALCIRTYNNNLLDPLRGLIDKSFVI